MKIRLLMALLAAAPVGYAWAVSPDASRGAEMLKPFKQQLMGALKSGLQQGPDQAISVCQKKAPEIASGLSIDGVEMGRSSHKLRNPDNAPPAWVSPVIEAYLADEAFIMPVALSAGEGRMGYIEPIRLKAAPCLMCHGETLAPAIAEKIDVLYPDDQATGFKEGDLRGVFWVSWPEE